MLWNDLSSSEAASPDTEGALESLSAAAASFWSTSHSILSSFFSAPAKEASRVLSEEERSPTEVSAEEEEDEEVMAERGTRSSRLTRSEVKGNFQKLL